MEEQVFLSSGTTSVTSSKIVIGGNTYATRNVGSVRLHKIDMPAWPGLLILVGLLVCTQNIIFGLTVVVFGVAAAYTHKSKVQLLLMAGGGESMALESSDKAAVQALHDAIVAAISAR